MQLIKRICQTIVYMVSFEEAEPCMGLLEWSIEYAARTRSKLQALRGCDALARA
jgi:hypothetical protein